MGSDEEVVALLRAILTMLEKLPEQIAVAVSTGSALTKNDRQVLAGLAPSISQAIGDMTFSTSDLLEEAKGNAELDDALSQAGLGSQDEKTPRRLGKLLARAKGFNEAGYVIECVGATRQGRLWRVVAGLKGVSTPQTREAAC